MTGAKDRGPEPESNAMSAMEIGELLRYLPHRYPFMLIDRVTACVPGERLEAFKNVTFNEPFFQGHFPERPVMPAVLIMEALAQATGVFALRTLGTLPKDDSIYYFVGIDEARFRKPVVPGDRLDMTITPIRHARGIWKVNAEARVDGALVASAVLMGALREAAA